MGISIGIGKERLLRILRRKRMSKSRRRKMIKGHHHS
jgi:hypothetical protein